MEALARLQDKVEPFPSAIAEQIIQDELGVRMSKLFETFESELVEEVPAGAVVVPGTRPKEFPSGTYDLTCALIIGRRTPATDEKTALNDYLRELDVQL